MTQTGPDQPTKSDDATKIAEALVKALASEPVPDHIRELAARLQAALDARLKRG
ncbi:hypothetical protein [Tabrizicola sp. BL-A-41-H6]|uniref:hypothetical protein n=1 Tax=Tabrizicola sp. BL-A-41-H6 TaxID=3421107 RepID=UPI003D675ECA